MTEHQALVLNADFRPLSLFPLSTLGWQDAVKAVVRDAVSVVAEYETIIRSPSTSMRLPSVIALREYVPVPRHVAFTRSNLFLRDGFQCQYCRELFSSRDLTFDHVVPRSAGGKTSWTNVVAACESCNTSKAHRMDMKPVRAPYIPTARELAVAALRFPPTQLHKSWIDFLYWDIPLEE